MFRFFLIFLSGFIAVIAQENTPYQPINDSAYTIFVENKALEKDETLTYKALSLLEEKLAEIENLPISQDLIDTFLAAPFFIDWHTTNSAAQYHPSTKWLEANDYYTGKVKAIEISNVKNFTNWTLQNQPFMVLHELVHYYHDNVLGFDDPRVLAAYQEALENEKYQNVLYHLGDNNYVYQAKAYALKDHKEYLAEISEAYFGFNDYYPFTKADLQVYDPVGFALCEALWHDDDSMSPSALVSNSVVSNEAKQFEAYPNPTASTLNLNFSPELSSECIISDSYGRVFQSVFVHENQTEIDLSSFPKGVYFLCFINTEKGTQEVLKVTKQ